MSFRSHRQKDSRGVLYFCSFYQCLGALVNVDRIFQRGGTRSQQIALMILFQFQSSHSLSRFSPIFGLLTFHFLLFDNSLQLPPIVFGGNLDSRRFLHASQIFILLQFQVVIRNLSHGNAPTLNCLWTKSFLYYSSSPYP